MEKGTNDTKEFKQTRLIIVLIAIKQKKKNTSQPLSQNQMKNLWKTIKKN